MNVHDVTCKLYNEPLEICEFSDANIEKTVPKYDPINLTLDRYDYTKRFKKR